MRTTVAPIALLLLFGGCSERGIGAAPVVSADPIRSINVGMTRAEVETILGPPMAFTGEYPDTKRFELMTYTRPLLLVRWYPMLWIQLQDGRVRGVYAKRYAPWSFHDELGIYGRSALSHWEGPEFERLFPD